MAENATVKGKYLEYLNKPLVREGDTICYGDLNEKYILILEILTYKKDNPEIPDMIMIQVVESKNQTNIVRQGTKNGLYDAFTMGQIWLDMALKSSK